MDNASKIKSGRPSEKPDELPSVLGMKPAKQGPRDYLAVSVFLAALVILIASVFFLIKNIDVKLKDKLDHPLASVSRWLKEADRYGKFLLGKIDETPSRKAEKHIRRGHKLFREKNFDKALAEYNQAVRLAPDNFRSYFWRGRTYIKIKKFDQAVKDFNQVLRLNGNFVDAYNNLGWLYGRRGEYDKSLRYLNRSIELKPDRGWTYYYRGHVYFRKGDLPKALKDTETACRLKYQRACRVYQQLKKEKKAAKMF